MLKKNVSGQSIHFFVYDGTTGLGVEGATISSMSIYVNDALISTDTISEIGGGIYRIDLTQEQTNVEELTIYGSYSTYIVQPRIIQTVDAAGALATTDMVMSKTDSVFTSRKLYGQIFVKPVSGYMSGMGYTIATSLIWPNAYYYNGKTYFTIMLNVANGSKSYITYYDHITKTFATPVLVHTPVGADNHAHGAIIITKDGYILFAAEKLDKTGEVHPSTICIYRTTEPENINSFVKVAEVGNNTTSTRSYPHFYIVGEKIYLILRDYSPSLFLYSSSDGGITWSGGVSGTQIVNGEIGSPGRSWMYVAGLQNSYDKIRVLIAERITLVSPERWRYLFYLESSDGDMWYNITNTYSHTISTDGAITRTSLVNNFTYDDTGSDLIINGCTGNTVYYGDREILYTITGSTSRALTYYLDGVKYQKTFPYTVDAAGTITTIVYSRYIIECVFQYNGLFYKVRTTDGGDNWNIIETIRPAIGTAWQVSATFNQSEKIPLIQLFETSYGGNYEFYIGEEYTNEWEHTLELIKSVVNILSVKDKTDNLDFTGTDVKATLDGEETILTSDYDAAKTAASQTSVDAIKAKTDNLPANPAAVGSEMKLENGAIKADTYDNVTAFPKNEMIY